MGKGFLTGMIDDSTTFVSTDFRNNVPRFSADNRKANQAIVDVVSRIVGEKKQRRRRVELARFFAREPWIVPIPGTPKLHKLEENSAQRTSSFPPTTWRTLKCSRRE